MRKTLVLWVGLLIGIICIAFSGRWAQAGSVSFQVPAATPTLQYQASSTEKYSDVIPLPFDFTHSGSAPVVIAPLSQSLIETRDFDTLGTIPPAQGQGPVVYVSASGYLSLLNINHPALPFWQVSELPAVTTPTWSHSGTRAAFSATGVDSTRCLYTLDLTLVHSATALVCGFDEILYPFWSPNDTHIVFFGHQLSGASRAWIVDSHNGTTLREVAPGLAQAKYPVWLDNDRVAFAADKADRVWAIHVASISSPTEPQALPGEFRCPVGCSCNPASEPLMAYPDVSPDRQKIGFVALSQNAGCNYAATVYQMFTDGSSQPTAVVDVAGGNGSYGWLRWASDNQRTALISTANDGRGRVRVIDMATGGLQTFDTQLAVPNRLEWAPDDSQLTVGFGNSTTDSAVYTVDPVTGAFTLLVAGKMPDWAPPVLKFEHTISGRVVDTTDNPLPDVVVSSGLRLSTTTDNDGVYALSGLITGTHPVVAAKTGYVFSPTVRTVAIPPNASNQNFVGTMENGLLAYYSFDDGTATDNSGNGYHGSMQGGTSVVDGILGKALAFNGQDTAVKTPANLEQSNSSSGVTLMAWVYPTSVDGGRHHVISSDNGGFDWSILREGDTWYVFTGEDSRSTGLKVDLDQWQLLVAVFTPSGEVKFYKNGQFVSIPHLDFDSHDNNIGIGHNPGYGEYFRGTIDEVRIYSRPLEEREVQAFYHFGYQVSGQVTDANGSPMPDVVVAISSGRSTTTDATGFYTLTNLVTGTYTITPTKVSYSFSPSIRTITVPPHATAQNFIGTPVPVTSMDGVFYNLGAHLGGKVVVDLALQTTQASGYINFTELSSDPVTLCGAGEFSGSRQGNALALSFTSHDEDPDCGFDHNALFTIAANIEGEGHIWGDYRSQNADGSSIAEYPGVFEAWSAGNQPQSQTYTGVFTDTTRNIYGTVELNIAVGKNTVSGNMDFSGLSGSTVFCGAGEFAGVNHGTSLEYSFVSTDDDPGCTFDGQTRFTVTADLSPDGIPRKGTYSTSNNQRGIFKLRSTSTPTSYSISGQVLDFGGLDNGGRKGIQGLGLTLFQYQGNNYFPVQLTKTDLSGKYIFANLTSGSYRIELQNADKVFDFSPSNYIEVVVVNSDKLDINFEEKSAFSCTNVVDGICIYRDPKVYDVAEIDLLTPGIKVELAKSFFNQTNGLFFTKPVQNLALEDSSAGDKGAAKYYYVAINATSKSPHIPTPLGVFPVVTSQGSILGIEGYTYGSRLNSLLGCVASPRVEDPCIDKPKASFFTFPYQLSNNSRPAIWRAGKELGDGAFGPGDFNAGNEVSIREKLDTAKFGVGFQSIILDAVISKTLDIAIPGFPQYTASSEDHASEASKTMLGLSCNGEKLFLATSFSKSYILDNNPTSTVQMARDLYKRGACRAIMLDGGGSTQFSGYLQEYGSFADALWYPNPEEPGLFSERSDINAIVVFNDSSTVRGATEVAVAPIEVQVSPDVQLFFEQNTFSSDAVLEYATLAPQNYLGYYHLNRFYTARVMDVNNNELQPQKAYRTVVSYEDDLLPEGADENSLNLYFYNDSTKQWIPEGSTQVNTVMNTVSATVSHFSLWALLIPQPQTHSLFLPLVSK